MTLSNLVEADVQVTQQALSQLDLRGGHQQRCMTGCDDGLYSLIAAHISQFSKSRSRSHESSAADGWRRGSGCDSC